MFPWTFIMILWLLCHVSVNAFLSCGHRPKLLHLKPSAHYHASLHNNGPSVVPFASPHLALRRKSALSTIHTIATLHIRQIFKLVLIPVVLQVFLISVFKVDPAIAGVVSSAAVSGGNKGKAVGGKGKAVVTSVPSNSEPKWQVIFKRIFYGANAKINFRKWRAGDTRGDNLMLLLNALSMGALLGGLVVVATVIGQREASKEVERMRKEVMREKKYRESMYVDAVKAILAKISDPNIKPSIKKDLSMQLRQLDPSGKIRQFIEAGEKGELDLGINVKSKREKSTDTPKRGGTGGSAGESAKKKDDSSSSGAGERGGRKNDEGKKSNEGQSNTQGKRSSGGNNGSNYGSGSKSSSAESAGSEKAVNKILAELQDSLVGDMPRKQIEKLVGYLKMRLMSISSEQKRSAALAKVSQKLGDNSYWKDFLEGMSD